MGRPIEGEGGAGQPLRRRRRDGALRLLDAVFLFFGLRIVVQKAVTGEFHVRKERGRAWDFIRSAGGGIVPVDV